MGSCLEKLYDIIFPCGRRGFIPMDSAVAEYAFQLSSGPAWFKQAQNVNAIFGNGLEAGKYMNTSVTRCLG
jgi:hypothetical protein